MDVPERVESKSTLPGRRSRTDWCVVGDEELSDFSRESSLFSRERPGSRIVRSDSFGEALLDAVR